MLSPLKYVQPFQLPLKMWVPHDLGRDVHKMAIFFLSVPVHAWIECIDRIISEAYSYETSEKVILNIFSIYVHPKMSDIWNLKIPLRQNI